MQFHSSSDITDINIYRIVEITFTFISKEWYTEY